MPLLFSSDSPESFEEARGGGLVVRLGEVRFEAPLAPPVWVPVPGEALWEFALWLDSDRWSLTDLTDAERGCWSSADTLLHTVISYGLKLDLGVSGIDPLLLLLPPGDSLPLSMCWPPFLDKLRPNIEEDEEDELDRDLVLFSMFAKSFGLGVESAPIELQVCANKAKGLFLASN